ncbi:MAG: hypothetical protein ACRC8A_15675 [Microcoleaceae cyanobacterium]
MKFYQALALTLSVAVATTTAAGAQGCMFKSKLSSTSTGLDALTTPARFSTAKMARIGGFGSAAIGLLGLGGVYLSRRAIKGLDEVRAEADLAEFLANEHPEAPGGELDVPIEQVLDTVEDRELVAK